MKNELLTKQNKRTGSAVVPHQPYSIVQRLQHEVNRLFADFGEDFTLWLAEPPHQKHYGLTAKIDVKDVGRDVIVTAEIPGVEMEDLNIAATPHYVSISGEKKEEKAEQDNGYYRMEREYGFFRRVIPMPCEIEKDRVDAVFKNGVLTLTLPKTKAALEEEKKVTVKAG